MKNISALSAAIQVAPDDVSRQRYRKVIAEYAKVLSQIGEANKAPVDARIQQGQDRIDLQQAALAQKTQHQKEALAAMSSRAEFAQDQQLQAKAVSILTDMSSRMQISQMAGIPLDRPWTMQDYHTALSVILQLLRGNGAPQATSPASPGTQPDAPSSAAGDDEADALLQAAARYDYLGAE